MSTDVLRLPGNYYIETARGGTITLDVGTGTNTGTVVIVGNLDVIGNQTVIESKVSTLADNTLVLNKGEPTNLTNGYVSLGVAGIQISRGNSDADNTSAFIQWNENAVWSINDPDVSIGAPWSKNGVFEFRVGTAASPNWYGAIKANALRMHEASAPVDNDATPRFNFFGNENPTAVLSVAGTANYSSRVTHPDDIPNKKYVDLAVTLNAGGAVSSVSNSGTYIKLIPEPVYGVASEIIGVIDGDFNDNATVLTTGTLVFGFGKNYGIVGNFSFTGTSINVTQTNGNLYLKPNGTGRVITTSSLVIGYASTPTVVSNQIGLRTGTNGPGASGVYFNSTSTTGELVSQRRALIYSLLF